MVIVRQSTARIIMVGPVLDASGVAVTSSVVGDWKISKNGGIPAALNASATLTHRHTGNYSLSLTATDLDTVGQAEVAIDATVNASPIKALTVVEEVVYDALFVAAAGGYGVQTGDAFARLGAPAGASVSADIAAVKAETATILGDTNDIQTRLPAALVTGRMDASVGAMATGVLTATAIAADAITDAKVAADVTIASVTGAVGSVTGAVGSVTGAVGSVTGNVGGTVASVVGAVGSVTGAVGSVTGNVGGSVASIAAAGITAASFAADAITAAKVAADVGVEIATSVWAELTSAHVVSGSFGQRLGIIRAGAAQAGAATTITLDAGASAVDDFYKTNFVFITAGTGVGQQRIVTAYNGTTKVATVAAWVTNPAVSSGFVLLPFGAIPDVGTVTGSVGSVSGAVGSVTSPVTVGTNNDKTGYAIGTGGIAAAAYAVGAVDAAALAADAATEIANAVLSAATTTPISADIKRVNATTLTGNGGVTPWGPV